MVPSPRNLLRQRWRDGYDSDDDSSSTDLGAHVFSDRESDLSSDNMSIGEFSSDSLVSVPSVIRRLVQICIGVTSCVLSAGIIFGYAALKPLLIEEGVYHHLCSDDELQGNGDTVCYRQNLRLDSMFTLAAIITSLASSPVHAILNDLGPRGTSMLGSTLLAVGALLLAFARQLPVIDGYTVGYCVLSLASTLVFASQIHLSEASRRFSGFIRSSLHAAVEASACVFLIFRILHSIFSLQTMFLLYLVVPAFIIFANLSIMPSTKYQRTKSERAPETHEELRYHYAVLEMSRDRRTFPSRESALRLLHYIPAKPLMRSPWCILLVIFSLVGLLRINYAIATIHEQSESLLGSQELAESLGHAFDLMLPIGGMVSIPFTRLVLNHSSLTTILIVLIFTTTLVGALGCVPHSMTAAYMRIIIFACHRPFFYASISHYTNRVFGFLNAAQIYGLVTAISGLGVSLIVPLDMLGAKVFDSNNESSTIVINVSLTTAGLISGCILCGYVYRKTKAMQNHQLYVTAGGSASEEDASFDGPVSTESEALLGSSSGVYSYDGA